MERASWTPPTVFVVLLFALAMPAPGRLSADVLCLETAKAKAANKMPLKALAFDLRDVRLLDGPFKHAMELDKSYLLSLDVDRLLHTYRLTAGLPSSARPLGGWEEPASTVRGHFLGHYLSACALMYASTGDTRLKQKGDAVVAGLAECQARLGNGYVSAFPESSFDALEQGKPVTVAYYHVHKTYAGLLDMYVYCDNQQALEVCKKAGDWVIARNAKLTDYQVQQVLGTEHGGINEVLADLYAITGEKKYLAIAQRLNHRAVLEPASKRVDALDRLHANTQIPKFIGAARQYELTGDDQLKTAASFFWDSAVKERSYAIGGVSDEEAFSPKAKLSEALGQNTTETCNTYNLLKLTRHLFCWEPRAEYADYYERALYNHILASQNPEDGAMCYYVPLMAGTTRGGGRAGYNTPLDSFWCCTGTGTENHAKYGDSIYFHDGDQSLYWNLFIASELNWKAKGVKLRQDTRYPDESTTRLTFTCEKPTDLRLCIRRPYWATAGFEIRVNGRPQTVASSPGDYAIVARQWANGDTVEVSMPFSLRMEGFRDNPHRVALMNGPLVLCAEVDAKLRPGIEISKPYPAAVAEEGKLLTSLRAVAGSSSTFTGPASVFRVSADPGAPDLTLEPFHGVHGNRHYVVYWDVCTAAEWSAIEAKRQAELAAEAVRLKQMKACTTDLVDPLDEQGEHAHNLQGERTAAGPFNGRKWRHATDGGWFSWDLKVQPNRPHQLYVTYWGSDVGREFDILVDGVKLASQKLDNNRPDQLYNEVYELPNTVIGGKDKITVRFQGRPGNFAGGVFECRVLKK